MFEKKDYKDYKKYKIRSSKDIFDIEEGKKPKLKEGIKIIGKIDSKMPGIIYSLKDGKAKFKADTSSLSYVHKSILAKKFLFGKLKTAYITEEKENIAPDKIENKE